MCVCAWSCEVACCAVWQEQAAVHARGVNHTFHSVSPLTHITLTSLHPPSHTLHLSPPHVNHACHNVATMHVTLCHTALQYVTLTICPYYYIITMSHLLYPYSIITLCHTYLAMIM